MVQITVRHVPDRVRSELASRAAAERKSMQEYLLEHLERLASRPSIPRWLDEVRRRKRASGTLVSADEILEHLDADRR